MKKVLLPWGLVLLTCFFTQTQRTVTNKNNTRDIRPKKQQKLEDMVRVIKRKEKTHKKMQKHFTELKGIMQHNHLALT